MINNTDDLNEQRGSVTVRVIGVTAEEYDALPEEEQAQYEVPIPEEELNQLFEAKDKITKRYSQLFGSVMDAPKPDWIVEGIAVKDGITLLFGDAGVGKTSLCLELIGCVTESKECLGLSTQQVATLLIEQDENMPLLRSHIERMLPLYPSLRWLKVPTVPILWDNAKADFEVSGKLLEELILFSSASIVVIDSISSLGIADINHPSTATIFDKLRVVAGRHHCAFILLHHPNKSVDVMGSNLIKAKVDVMLHLQKDKLVFEKLRGSPPTIATIEAGESPYISLRQDSETLTFSVVQNRAAFIQQLWVQNKPRAEIIDLVCQTYGGKKDTVGKAVDREKQKLPEEGKLPPTVRL